MHLPTSVAAMVSMVANTQNTSWWYAAAGDTHPVMLKCECVVVSPLQQELAGQVFVYVEVFVEFQSRSSVPPPVGGHLKQPTA